MVSLISVLVVEIPVSIGLDGLCLRILIGISNRGKTKQNNHYIYHDQPEGLRTIQE
jgi:hypothetical protein